ncbi:MAG: hypothetical protein WDN06_00920, partial [Asticcacaulis sp.]
MDDDDEIVESVMTGASLAGVFAGSTSGGSVAEPAPIWTTASIDDESTFVANQAGYTVSLPAMTVSALGAKLHIAATTVTFDAVASTQVTDAPMTWRIGAISSPTILLTCSSYTGLAIRTALHGGGTLLTLDSDYAMGSGDRGWGLSTANAASGSKVYASYTGYERRYDLVYGDPVTGVLGIAKGTDRQLDPENYGPTLPSGKIALFWAFVTNTHVQLLPALKFRDFEMSGEEAYWRQLIAWNRKQTAPFWRQVEKAAALQASGGSATAVAAITPAFLLCGDSTQAAGKAQNPAQNLTPNGVKADDANYLNGRGPADTAKIPRRYSQTYDDTGSTNLVGAPFANYVAGSANHMMAAPVWKLRKAVHDRYGIWCPVLNMGWSGTNSGNYISINGRKHAIDPGGWVDGVDDVRMGMLFPTRLAAILSNVTTGTMVLPGHGTNELGASATYANFMTFIPQVKALGGCVFIPGCRFPAIDRKAGDGVRIINEQLTRAAADGGAAISPIYKIEGPGYEGAGGLAAASFGNHNGYNHPTLAQWDREGRLFVKSLGL